MNIKRTNVRWRVAPTSDRVADGMIGMVRLFHGFKGVQRAQSIRRRGLVIPTTGCWEKSSWCAKIGLPPSVFLATSLKSSKGTNPLEFAVPKGKRRMNGYIAVVEIPWDELGLRLRGIWRTVDIEASRASVDRFDAEYGSASRHFARDKPATSIRRVNLKSAACRNPKNRGLRDLQWLIERRKSRVQGDCQVISHSIPAEYVVKIKKVFSAKSGRLECAVVGRMRRTYGLGHFVGRGS